MKNNYPQFSKELRIAVVYGGKSKERPGSLISGMAVYKSLKRQGFKNSYLVDTIKKRFVPQISKSDVVFLILHGRHGEDGKIQGFLETMEIPYTGPGVLTSAIGMDKHLFKDLLISFGIPTPPFEIIPNKININISNKIVSRLGLPLFLKPLSEGGSLGSNVIHSKEQLLNDINKFTEQGFDKFLVEKYINGKSLTVGILQKDNKITVLPILETISKKEFYDYEAKHNPKLHIYECPAKLKNKTAVKVNAIAKRVFKSIRCYGFCRVDFMLDTKTNIPYVLEVNTLPGMSLHSNMATSAKAAGINYDHLVINMLKTAFGRPRYLP